MRVCHIITRLIVGGAQENTIASVLGLRRLTEWTVDLISGPTTGPEGSLEEQVRELGPHFIVVPELIRAVHPLRDLQAYRTLARILRALRPDIVHTHSGKAGFLGRWAAHRAKVPVIVHTIHGPSFGPFQSTAGNVIFRAAEQSAGRITTHFVSVAQAMSEQYLAAGIGQRNRYTRIFSGFNLKPFLEAKNDAALRQRLGIKPADIVIGKIARLFELKGHDDLITVAPEIIRACPTVKFLWVGDGSWRARLQERIDRLGLSSHFVLVGLVPPAEVPGYLGLMDVLVHLSRREGLARALPQALATGCPVVAYDCDGAGEVCRSGETGFLVPPNDLATLTRQILELVARPELRRRMGICGRERVIADFDEARMVERLAALYRRLAADAGISGSAAPEQTLSSSPEGSARRASSEIA